MSLSLLPQVLKRYMNDVFIETGTYDGGGVRRALECGFRRVISIEIDRARAKSALEKLKGEPGVEILEGDSAELLPWVLSELEERATIFLDAHPMGAGDPIRRGKWTWPLVQELRSIAARSKRKDHSILIDDRHEFGVYGTTDDEVFKLLHEINPAYAIRMEANGRSLTDMIGASVPITQANGEPERTQEK